MRTMAIIVLSAVLAAALVAGIVLYQGYRNTRDALLVSEERLAELNETVSRLTEEAAALHDKLAEGTERVRELEGTQARISELGTAINVRDQRLSESQKRLHTVQGHLEEEKEAKEALKAELSSRDASLAELRRRLEDAQSRGRLLEEAVAEKHGELERLGGRLRALKGEKASAETRIGQLKSTYEALISDLKEQIDKQEVTIKRFEEKISVTFVDRILFAFGRARITPEGEGVLRKVGQTIKAVRGKRIRVVGHTDDRPIQPDYYYKFPSNWELSAARASAVVRHLQEDLGLDPSHLEAVGRSFYDPVASNQTPEGRAQNRRVEIIIAP